MVGDDADTTARVKAAIATGSPKDGSTEWQVLDAAQKAAPGHRINSFMAPMH
jgi:hypothetical protein